MADIKISNLSAQTSATATDIFPVVDDIGGTPTTKKITFANLESSLTLGNQVGAPTGTIVGDSDTQTLTNKTITTPTLTLKQGAAPAPTAEGDIQWDTDDNKIKVGDGVGTKTFSDDSSNASSYAGISHTHVEADITDIGNYALASQINDTAYDATSWNVNTDAPTKNAVRDQFEAEPSATRTLTNKRITKRVGTTTSSATPTINTDNFDAYSITALAADITSMTTNLSGTPSNFDELLIRIKDDGTARAIAWGASFQDGTATLPTTTVTSKTLLVGLIYDGVDMKWTCEAVGSRA